MKYLLVVVSIFTLFTGCLHREKEIVIVKTPIIKSDESSIKRLEKKDEILEKKIDEIKEQLEIVEKKIEPKVIIKEKTKVVVVEKPISTDSKMVVGAKEYVYIPSFDLKYRARIDTGATTSSMHAKEIKEFERDGQRWVKFLVKSNDGNYTKASLPIQRVIHIKRHNQKNQKRYVVKLRVNLGDFSEVIDVSLTNREKFNYPMLIGRNYLNGYILVDVSKKYITKLQSETK